VVLLAGQCLQRLARHAPSFQRLDVTVRSDALKQRLKLLP
jgi:hypothetical protein